MNAQFAKDDFGMLYPSRDGYAMAARQSTLAGSGLGRAFLRAVEWVAETRRRHAVLNELEMLNDHELADIGLARSEVRSVFNPDFAASRAFARD